MVWCGDCYQKDIEDRFHINELTDEDGNDMYDCESDTHRYKRGIDGSHLITPFQCDLCIFRTLYKRDPRSVELDRENLKVIRRMNLDSIWAREPSTTLNNMRTLGKLISTCEGSGFSPELPSLGPYPLSDDLGYCVAFSMLIHSRKPGKHTKLYTQFATIRKQRSAYSNLYSASKNSVDEGVVVAVGAQTSARITQCATNSLWFSRWSSGCETRMGFVIKQNKAISITVMKKLIENFNEEIRDAAAGSWNQRKLCMGLVYSIISFTASLRGSEGLKLDIQTLIKHWERGNHKVSRGAGKSRVVPHVIVPLKGRFKGEKGERCHLLPLSNETSSGIKIRSALELLLVVRRSMSVSSPWAFVNDQGDKLSFADMNEIVLERLEELKEDDAGENELELREVSIREDFSINRSFRRGSSTHAQNQKIPEPVINAQNRWRKVEAAKGRRAKFSMLENYSDIEHLVPTLVRYSEML
jgi:hypothetical protein